LSPAHFAAGARASLPFLCCQFGFTAAIFGRYFSIRLERTPETQAPVSAVDFLIQLPLSKLVLILSAGSKA
jgi:hypothetical protein